MKKLGNYLLCAVPVVGEIITYRHMREYDEKTRAPLTVSVGSGLSKLFSSYLMMTPEYSSLGLIIYLGTSFTEGCATNFKPCIPSVALNSIDMRQVR